jgi:hypothetical protein
MERTAAAIEKTNVYIESLREVDRKYWENNGPD